MDLEAFLHEGVLIQITAKLEREQIDLALDSLARDHDAANAPTRRDPADLEDDVVKTASGRDLERARTLDLAGHDDLEGPWSCDRDRRLREPEHRFRTIGDATVGLEQRQAPHRDGPEGRDGDLALVVDDGLLADRVKATGNLHVEDITGGQSIVGPGHRASGSWRRLHAEWHSGCR